MVSWKRCTKIKGISEEKKMKYEEFEKHCKEKKLRFTRTRRDVYLLLEKADPFLPLTAYQILGKLSKQEGKELKPPTVYRALSFLLNAGAVHRIESTHTYVLNRSRMLYTSPRFFICESCGHVSTLGPNSIPQRLKEQLTDKGYDLTKSYFEIKGLCNNCVKRKEEENANSD